MDKRFAIFDMDGTLVDSMAYWERLAEEYLARHGVTEVPDDIPERIKPMTMADGAELLIGAFGLGDTVEQIVAEQNGIMAAHYRHDVPLKPGVEAYLKMLSDRGVTMCVASATATELVQACLTRLGVREYFRFLVSCESIGVGKEQPDIYNLAASLLGAEPGDIAVFEDADYAVKSAKAAGFYVTAVYDDAAKEHWEEIIELADEYITGWQ